MLKTSVTSTKVHHVFAKAPRFDGARAWWELRRKYEVLGNSVLEKLNQKLATFAPKISKDPEEMIKYEFSPTADKWSDDRKLRLIWKHVLNTTLPK